MKVLMLGWEFPPHISGGLGTACAGLTQALEKENVDIKFVIPKLHGGERADGIAFINASTIPIQQRKKDITEEGPRVTHNPVTTVQTTSAPDNSAKGKRHSTRSVIEVESFLTPYTLPSEDSSSFGLERWNYSFPNQANPGRLAPPGTGTLHEPKNVRFVKEPYPFTGKYGSNLLEEVDRYARATAEIARRNSFDVIHAHDWMTYRAGLAAKKISGKPLIVHVHATEVDRSGSQINQEIFQIEREGMSQADRVVAVSHWTKNIAVQHYSVPAGKIEVIHNGINPGSNENVKRTKPPVGSQIVTFLGRITHQKGPLYFVDAARRVHEKFPDVHFVVAGSGDQLPLMIERIAQLRLSRHFHFTGFLRNDDIDRLWAMSNIYVMPSVSEPFGITPLEAMRAGVPVILSKQAGVGEVMPHAIKVDFWNCEAFAEAICSVLRFKSLANTLKKNGAEEIRNISWDKAAKKLTTLYHELNSKHEQREGPGPVLSGSSAKTAAHATFL